MRCPRCGLINPNDALKCDCGYNFPSSPHAKTTEGGVRIPGSTESHRGIGRAVFSVGFLALLLFWALLLIGSGGDVEKMKAANLVFLVSVVILSVPRILNLGKRGAWSLGFLVPGLNVYLFFLCLYAPRNYARRGALDKAGLIAFLASIGALLVAVCLLVIMASA